MRQCAVSHVRVVTWASSSLGLGARARAQASLICILPRDRLNPAQNHRLRPGIAAMRLKRIRGWGWGGGVHLGARFLRRVRFPVGVVVVMVCVVLVGAWVSVLAIAGLWAVIAFIAGTVRWHAILITGGSSSCVLGS